MQMAYRDREPERGRTEQLAINHIPPLDPTPRVRHFDAHDDDVQWRRFRVEVVVSRDQPNTGTRTRRTIVEVSRTRDEKLEDTARRLVNGLREWLDSN